MINTQELEQKINSSSLHDSDKRIILSLLPKLGSRGIAWVYQQFFKFSFEENKQSVVASLLAVYDFLTDLSKDRYWQTMAEYLSRGIASPDYRYGKNFIPFVLDIKEMDAKKAVLGKESLQAILNFELSVFEYLPEEEYLALLQGNLVWLAGFLRLTDSFKQVQRSVLFSDLPEWPKPYVASLESSTELLSDKPILVDAKQTQPQIKNWILDFTFNSKTSASARTSLDVVQYLEKSPNARIVDPKGREILLEILKLYAWLTNSRALTEDTEIDTEESDTAKVGTSGGGGKPVVPKPLAAFSRAVNIQDSLLSGAGFSGLAIPQQQATSSQPASTTRPPKPPQSPPSPLPPHIKPSSPVESVVLKPNIVIPKVPGAINVQTLLNNNPKGQVSVNNKEPGIIPRSPLSVDENKSSIPKLKVPQVFVPNVGKDEKNIHLPPPIPIPQPPVK